ncbi:hypothetical protein ACH3VS_12830 [Streptomyces sp. WSLK1-3]|uniref:hypothetical protein n=1 Tax=Streptomyces sp. WSLK1-3 TaxID=3375475 RepID=UPI003787A065
MEEYVSSLAQLKSLLGVPAEGGGGSFDTAERALGITLPQEVKEFCSIYGDLLISDHIFIFGPKFMAEKGEWVSGLVREGHPTIPKPVLPDAGGMLHWGHSIEGDKFFLEDRGSGRWTVSAFRRNWHDWYESDETLTDWLLNIFSGRRDTDWMPEWPNTHWFE